MSLSLKPMLVGLTLALWNGFAAAEAPPKTIIAVDISGSSTFLSERSSAQAAARYVLNKIAAMDAPHDLMMVSLGDAGLAHRAIDIRAQVTQRRATSAKRLARQFAHYVASLPALVERGKLKPDDTTSIIDFFQSLTPICKAASSTTPVTILVFTDGVEWSQTVNGRAFLRGKTALPQPSAPMLTGCAVEMHGVGQLKASQKSGGLAKRLIPIWRDWLGHAGAQSAQVTGGFFGL